MGVNLILVITVGVLVTFAVLLRLFAPQVYYRYILRGMSEPPHPPQKSSKAAAIAALVALLFICVHLGTHVFTVGQSTLHQSVTRRGTAMQMESWMALLCVSATGVVLCLFPVAVITRLSHRRIILSSGDESAAKKIKTLGRGLGVLFLIGAVLIARRLV